MNAHSYVQTNFSIEEDIHAAIATPQPRLCDVCTEDREATHKCTQCQQRFFSPCCRVHDSANGCRGHTVVSLGHGEDAECGDTSESGQKKKEEMCPKHPDQRLMLHCSMCDVKICFQCKLSQHEGHPTQDLVDVQAKVKASLQGTLGKVEQQMQQIDQVVLAAEDQCSKLQQQQKKTEQELKHHADTLHQWVDQVKDEAVARVQSVTEGMVTALQGRIQQLRNILTTLHAQRDHTTRVLKDGEDADMASLESQLNAGDFEGVDLKKIEKELTTEIPAFNIKRNNTSVNELQLRSFVGILDPVAAGGGDGGPQSADRSASAVTLSDVSITEKRPPRRIVYSRNPQSTVLSICPVSKGRLWIKYKPGCNNSVVMKLFDIQGQELKKINKTDDGKLVAVNEDDIVSHQNGRQLHLIKPDGTVTTHYLEFNIGSIATCAEDGQMYIRESNKPTLYQVQLTGTDKLLCSKQNIAFRCNTQIKTGYSNPYVVSSEHCHLSDVSSAGQYFAFIVDNTVNLHARTATSGCLLYASYTPTNKLVSTRFCKISEQEVLLVLTEDKVHVLDHSDCDHFLCYLDTGNLKLDRASCLGTDYHRHVWIGCMGGTVVQVDL